MKAISPRRNLREKTTDQISADELSRVYRIKLLYKNLVLTEELLETLIILIAKTQSLLPPKVSSSKKPNLLFKSSTKQILNLDSINTHISEDLN